MIKRKVLSVTTKTEIIRRIEKGEKKSAVSKIYGLPSSTISSLWKNKDAILAAFQNKNAESKRLKKCEKPDLDEALSKWCTIQTNAGLPLNGILVKEQALKLAEEFGYEDFTCSNGWITRFKTRNNVTYVKVPKEEPSKTSENLKDSMADWVQKMWQVYNGDNIADGVSTEVSREQSSLQCSVISDATTDWLETVWLDYRGEYSEDDIYNAEEIGLFYDATPDQIQLFNGEKCARGELPENRLTVLVCANMSGTDKRKLLVIGHSAKASCFKNIKQLPVDYASNLKVWMTPETFTTYVHQWDSEMRNKDRQIILLIDNGVAHTNISNLTNIKLVFIPPNSASTLLPLHQGVIRSLKTFYRKELIVFLNNKMKKNAPLTISVLEAIRMISDAWYEIPSEYIRNCFVKAMLQSASDDEESPRSLSEWMELEHIEVFRDVENIEDFIDADDGVATSGIPTAREIVAEMKITDTSPEGDDDEKPVIPHLTEVFESADCLQRFFETVNSSGDELFKALSFIRQKLREQRQSYTEHREEYPSFEMVSFFIVKSFVIVNYYYKSIPSACRRHQ